MRNVLCFASSISQGNNFPFCLRLSYSEWVQRSTSRELTRDTASLGLNISGPEVVQFDPAMNSDQLQSTLSNSAVMNANY